MTEVIRTASYEFDKSAKRIDWIFAKNAGAGVASVDRFVEEVNNAYYRHSAELYDERFCDDISRQYKRIFSKLRIGNGEEF